MGIGPVRDIHSVPSRPRESSTMCFQLLPITPRGFRNSICFTPFCDCSTTSVWSRPNALYSWLPHILVEIQTLASPLHVRPTLNVLPPIQRATLAHNEGRGVYTSRRWMTRAATQWAPMGGVVRSPSHLGTFGHCSLPISAFEHGAYQTSPGTHPCSDGSTTRSYHGIARRKTLPA